MAGEEDYLTPFQLRAVHIGVQASLMAVGIGALYLLLPGDQQADRGSFALILLGGGLGAVTIGFLPWKALFARGGANVFFYGWSLINITLISAAIVFSGGGDSVIYAVYGLTTIFFGVVFNPRAQIALLLFTFVAYIAAVGVSGWNIALNVMVVRLGFIGTLAFLASFLARELKHLMVRQRDLALHDSLTGLPNRRLLQDRAEQALIKARRTGDSVAVMIVDLDRFKEVNDTLGHPCGDQLLKQVASRLSSALREVDTIARLGGDEFAILISGIEQQDDVTVVSERVRGALADGFEVEGVNLEVDYSSGIAIFPEHGEDVDTLIQKADVALYSAKDSHSESEIYSFEQDRHSTARLKLLNDLRRAVDRGEMVVHYQPKVDIKTRDVLGAEALVRWNHPELGMLPPNRFVPLAEQSTVVRRITRFVLDDALAQAVRWRAQGHDLTVSVNLSVRDLQDPQLVDVVSTSLRRHKADPQSLELEITEGSIMADPDQAITVLTQLQDMGVRLALDDFGTGYSSLAHLRHLPVHAIKIDRGFVCNLSSNHKDAAIVRSTIELARNLKMQVIAEGVETEEIVSQLQSMGCDLAQGFYFFRPAPASELDTLLKRVTPRAV